MSWCDTTGQDDASIIAISFKDNTGEIVSGVWRSYIRMTVERTTVQHQVLIVDFVDDLHPRTRCNVKVWISVLFIKNIIVSLGMKNWLFTWLWRNRVMSNCCWWKLFISSQNIEKIVMTKLGILVDVTMELSRHSTTRTVGRHLVDANKPIPVCVVNVEHTK